MKAWLLYGARTTSCRFLNAVAARSMVTGRSDGRNRLVAAGARPLQEIRAYVALDKPDAAERWLRESLPWLKLSGTILAWSRRDRAGNPRADHRRHSLRCSLSCAWKAGGYSTIWHGAQRKEV